MADEQSFEAAFPASCLFFDAAGSEAREERDIPVIPSGRLLLGRQSVTIDHEGMRYVLRATRAGKLILTK